MGFVFYRAPSSTIRLIIWSFLCAGLAWLGLASRRSELSWDVRRLLGAPRILEDFSPFIGHPCTVQDYIITVSSSSRQLLHNGLSVTPIVNRCLFSDMCPVRVLTKIWRSCLLKLRSRLVSLGDSAGIAALDCRQLVRFAHRALC